MSTIPTNFAELAPLLCSDIEALSSSDLAQALSQLTRHNGRTLRPITEAEHAVHLMTVLETDYQITDPCVLLAGLLHNAHTVLMGSLSLSMRTVLSPTWSVIEGRVRAAFLRRYSVYTAHASACMQIEGASRFVVSAECSQLMLNGNQEHHYLIESRPAPKWLGLGSWSTHGTEDWCQIYLANLNALQEELAHRIARISCPPITNHFEA